MQQPPAILQVHREHKYKVDDAEALRLEQIVEAHLPLRPRFHGERATIVRGTYLDFADGSMTARSLATPEDSQKVRYRHYERERLVRVTVEQSVMVWIEVKVRFGEVVTKERVQFHGVFIPQLLTREVPPPKDATALEALLARGPLQPVVGVQYRRIAFEDESIGLRVTIDRDVEFHEPAAPGVPGPMLGMLGGSIVEAKSAHELPAWLNEALAGKEAPSFSKFQAAVQSMPSRR